MDENATQPSIQKYHRFEKLKSVFAPILALLIIVVVFLGALNYFNLLPISQKLPLLSFLPTSSSIPGSCQILEEKFCSKAELLERKASDGTIVKLIGINLPPGTPVFSNLDSLLTKMHLTGEIKGMRGSIGGTLGSDTSIPNFNFLGDIIFENMADQKVNKGDIIGYIGDTGDNNFGYNLIITVGAASENEQNVEKYLKPMFPEAFEKPAKKLADASPNASSTSNYAGVIVD